MSLKWPKPGQLDVPLYQVSSIPWVTQSFLANDENVRKIEFPRVTRWVEIENDSSEENCLVNWAFSANGFGSDYISTLEQKHFISLYGGVVKKYDIRVKELWLSNSQGDSNYTGGAPFSIRAGLTEIPVDMFPTLTGSKGGTMSGIG